MQLERASDVGHRRIIENSRQSFQEQSLSGGCWDSLLDGIS